MSELDKAMEKIRKENEFWKLQREKTEYYGLKVRFRKQLDPWYKFGYQLLRGLIWFGDNVCWPILKVFRWAFGWIFLFYRWLWGKFVNRTDKFGNKSFSTFKAGIFVTGTVISFYIWYIVLGFMFDTGLYFLTVVKDEKVYLTNEQEIYPQWNIWSVQGCHELPCSDHNSIYYRVDPNLFNQVWSLVHGRGLFFADFVAAAVPVDISECTVTSYGVRWKLFLRGTEIYPYLLKVECSPVKVEERK